MHGPCIIWPRDDCFETKCEDQLANFLLKQEKVRFASLKIAPHDDNLSDLYRAARKTAPVEKRVLEV